MQGADDGRAGGWWKEDPTTLPPAGSRDRCPREGWHFSCERGCTRDDHGKAGPFSVEPLKMDLPFANCVCVQTSAAKCRPYSCPDLPRLFPRLLRESDPNLRESGCLSSLCGDAPPTPQVHAQLHPQAQVSGGAAKPPKRRCNPVHYLYVVSLVVLFLPLHVCYSFVRSSSLFQAAASDRHLTALSLF